MAKKPADMQWRLPEPLSARAIKRKAAKAKRVAAKKKQKGF